MTEYRIDDLARAAGVSVRNVRVYQDRGLLPPPRKQGRTGWYNDSHLARLTLIGRMLDRGYTFATISELLSAARYGLQVSEILETENPDGDWKALRRSRRLSFEDLREMFGADGTERNIARGTELGALVPTGDDFAVPQRRLIDAAQVLVDAGIPLGDILDQAEAVRADLADVAARFVAVVADRYMPGDDRPLDLDEATVSEMAALVNQIRPLAHDTVQSMFAEAMETAISRSLEQMAARMGEDRDESTRAG
ncbi:MerR family transcriptional regulator [Rhodococcus triatomae]|uniref:MerR HTH family regulatory protein n=1 Tax=Rhodococcus triatomae TaxID=300028 RepID=A0A1G8RNR7_9NOCA|nr:MerR family transcriptional regulator [Rhodococcus triatomae]QNG19892.1 MerR family transcriptional regulator [Rhodococcus triatomae]QNG24193.1 MerR family transcriptional regulator [Rhodococcus triatomae]SDJ18586.1 MerR HTH family regulatory protein [Rhodococcus triatomae]